LKKSLYKAKRIEAKKQNIELLNDKS